MTLNQLAKEIKNKAEIGDVYFDDSEAIRALLDEREKLRSALEFYAKEESWDCPYCTSERNVCMIVDDIVIESAVKDVDKEIIYYAGKHAKEALALGEKEL